MNKNVIVGFLAILVLVGGFILFSRRNVVNAPTTLDTEEAQVSPTTAVVSPTDAMGDESAVKEFAVEGSSFAFNPTQIRVKEGDRVKIVFTNKNGMHDWVLDEFDVRTKVTSAGQSDTVEFVANKKDTFEYYCSIGNHRQQGMVGNLIVE